MYYLCIYLQLQLCAVFTENYAGIQHYKKMYVCIADSVA